MNNLRETYPIRRIRILRAVLGKLLGLIITAALLLAIVAWKSGGTNDTTADIADVAFSSLVVAVFAILILIDATYEAIYISKFKYFCDETSITIRKGVLSMHEITLPFSRITDLYVDQSFMDTFFGLYDLHFSTPTSSSGSAAHIEGLSKEHCYALRSIVLGAIKNAS